MVVVYNCETRPVSLVFSDGDQHALAAALNGCGGVLFASGAADRAEPFLAESARVSEAGS
jgi:hypothetical protein